MRVVKAERWHKVNVVPTSGSQPPQRMCSACGSHQLGAPSDTVIDATTLQRYRVVRCQQCGYDLLEAVAPSLAAAS